MYMFYAYDTLRERHSRYVLSSWHASRDSDRGIVALASLEESKQSESHNYVQGYVSCLRRAVVVYCARENSRRRLAQRKKGYRYYRDFGIGDSLLYVCVWKRNERDSPRIFYASQFLPPLRKIIIIRYRHRFMISCIN